MNYILRIETPRNDGGINVKNKIYKNAYVFTAKERIEARFPEVHVRIFKEVQPEVEQLCLFDEKLDFYFL